jgi:ornithine lipid ester-linked acyl 2-hydroxylase
MEFTDKNPKYFYTIDESSNLKLLESNYSVILQELNQLIQNSKKGFWHINYPEYVKSKLNNNWKAYSFRFFGIKNTFNCDACPNTESILNKIPGIITADFSYLPPHTHIKPHTGFTKMILRVHLGLIIPKDCSLRVGDQTRIWEQGKLLMFDDSFEHEAWNNSDEDRYILMIDIPNPLWGYTANEISKYKIENLTDEYMLSLFPKERWMEFLEKGELDIFST